MIKSEGKALSQQEDWTSQFDERKSEVSIQDVTF